MTDEKILTIKDVARMSGLSIGTVSRVMNNSGAVSETARKKVSDVIRDTGYQPNSAARSMVNKKSGIIGIVVPEFTNPFIARLVELLARSLGTYGLSILLCNSGYRYDNISRFTDDLIQRNAEGVIFVASDICNEDQDEEKIERIRQKLNVVLINSFFGGFDSVNIADWQAAFDMVEYLISMGHRRIACMGYHHTSNPTMERYRGYCDAMKKHGLQLDPHYQHNTDEYSIDMQNRGYVLTRNLLSLDEPPSAIFAINDYYALNAYFAVKEKGLEVGKDVSVAGFDNVEMGQLVNPSLTTVKCQVESIAELAAEMLLKKIAGERSLEPRSVQLTGELIKRDSVTKYNG